ncbi:Glutamate--tRNA ligase 1 [Symmachiella dynata]|uniref:Glutamate--tRNA ligase n=1 Tax=Symmachiella dynata TaxID=2527995 RepID=A0A517ZL00_9PLAN|nr:glutamate--tRNA ligase [Symmachiella dynata]QDU43137.1 Glutamate--tRNA ligase 1 [Symmachiella dynata]
MSAVRTRFAPSPTGYMHIGGMRTALFNWLWARHNGGQFILRIDDTDQQRNMDAAIGPILRAFRWLGLDWDEGVEVGGPHGPYFQSQRGDLYQAAAARLLEQGLAYRCYSTPEEIAADRAAAEAEKRQYVHVRRSLELTDAQLQQYHEENRPYVVRFLMPRDEAIVIDDLIRGRVEFDPKLISDPVIMRTDQTPLYNFATVIDDSHAEISHVIRAEEHLSNTPIQLRIHEALGHTPPLFAHVPYVAAPGTKEKLSKRKLDKYRNNPQFKRLFERGDEILPKIGLGDSAGLDPVMVEYYERMGYLPDAMVNGLARLGWSLDDKTEIMSRKTIVDNFSLDRVIKSPAGLDPDKLLSYQAHWMGELSDEEKMDACLPYLTAAKFIEDPDDDKTREFIGRLIAAVADRLKVFSDILDYEEFFVADDALQYDEKAFAKRITKPEDAVDLLTKFQPVLETVEPFDAANLETALKSFVEEQDTKIGRIIHALRIAVTGKPAGPGMFDCLELLGRERCVSRITLVLSRV